jgi:prepilin-type N-terminal cleavage/methylation domain-containing protein
MRISKEHKNGFSLIELLVVVSVIGILATFAVLGAAVIRKEYVTSRTKEIFADLQKARADAMAGGTRSTDLIQRNIHGVGIQFTSPTTYVIFRFNDIIPAAATIAASGNYQYDSVNEQLDPQTVTISASELSIVNGAVLTPPANQTIIFDRFGYPRQPDWTQINFPNDMIIAISNPNLAGYIRCIRIQANSIREGFLNGNACNEQ